MQSIRWRMYLHMQPTALRSGWLKHLRSTSARSLDEQSLWHIPTECLLYATFWFCLILSELIGAAKESADVNRERAPSGPVKVVVTNQPHSLRPQRCRPNQPGFGFRLAGLARLHCAYRRRRRCHPSPARGFLACHHRVFEGLQRDAVDQVLQAVKFTDKNAPGLSLALDEEFQSADCFAELIRGYTMGVVEPYIMMGLQPTGPTESQPGSNCTIPQRTYSCNVEADSHSASA